MFGAFISLACLLIFLQNVCIESFSVINRRSSDAEGSENDEADLLVPEQSTESAVGEEKQATASEDDETTKNANSYLPTFRYIEATYKPIIFIRKSKVVDDTKTSNSELKRKENDGSSSPIGYDKTKKKNNYTNILSVRVLDVPSVKYMANYGFGPFAFTTSRKPRSRVVGLNERDSEEVDYTEPAEAEFEESENDELEESKNDELEENRNDKLKESKNDELEENEKAELEENKTDQLEESKSDEIEKSKNGELSTVNFHNEPGKKNNNNKNLSVKKLDEPYLEHTSDDEFVQFDFQTTKKSRGKVTSSNERDVEEVDYTEPAEDELEESENDDSSLNDQNEPRKKNNNNDDLSVGHSEEYGADYESSDYIDETTEKSRSKWSTRPMKQKAKFNEFKEDIGDTDIGIKLKITSKRNKNISDFTYANETELPENDEDLFAREIKRQEPSKEKGEFLKSFNIKKYNTSLKQKNSNPREISMIKDVNNTKYIYDNSRGSNESYALNNETENKIPKLFDKFKKSFRNHLAKIHPSSNENITINNFSNDIKNLKKSRREMKSSVTNQQIQNNSQLFPRDKRKSRRSKEHYSVFNRRRNMLSIEKNQEKLRKKFRYKRENGDEDKTGELLDKLQKLLVKANIARYMSSDFKSTVAPIQVFDFTPLPNTKSLMSESDFTTFFVHHIIPFLVKNSKTDELDQEPIKEHGKLAKREMQDGNVFKIKMTKQEFNIRSRDGRSQDNNSLLSDILLTPNVHSRSAARLMTQEKVKNRDNDLKPRPLTITGKFPINLESSTLNISKRNSTIEQEPNKKYFKNKRYYSHGFNSVPAVAFKTQFAGNSNHLSSTTFKEKRDDAFPENKVTERIFVPKNQTLNSRSADNKHARNNSNFPLNNLLDNSDVFARDARSYSIKNDSDINVLKVPESSYLVSDPLALGFPKQDALDVSDIAGNLLESATEGLYITENFAKDNKFSYLDQNPPNLYITPSDILYAKNNLNLHSIYLNNNSENGNVPSGTENTNFSPSDELTSEKLIDKKSISSSLKGDGEKAQKDAIVISIRIPESILKQLAYDAVFGQKNGKPRQVPKMMSQVLSTNLPKFTPRLIGTEQIPTFLENKTKNLKVVETMVGRRSEYFTDKDINDVNIKRNFRKEIVTSNKSSTFDDGQENDNSDLPTSTDLINQEEMLFSKKSLKRKYLPNSDEPEFDEISTRNRNREAYVPENQSSDIINRTTGNENIISKANAKDKDSMIEKVLLQNNNLKANENAISETYLATNYNQENENQKKLLLSHLQISNKHRIRKNNKKGQMKRRTSHLAHKNRHRKHKGHFRKSRERQNTNIKKQGKLGKVRRRSKSTTTDKYNSNEQSTEQISTENSNINLKIAPDLFLDWIVSTSNDLNKNPEKFKNNYKEAPLNLSLLANEKIMNFQNLKDLPHLNYEEQRHAEPYVTGIENINEMQTENKTKTSKNMEFERSITDINKSSIDQLSEKLLKSFKGPDIDVLLYGNTSLDNFLDTFYKISRNTTTFLPRVQRKNISKNKTTEKHGTNKPILISHKNDSKNNDKLSHEKIKGHHQNASQEEHKKKSDKRKKLHELTQNLKMVVREFVNRHTNDEQKKKLMYHAALKKLPFILKKHINVLQ